MRSYEAEGKPSLNRAKHARHAVELLFVDPKPGDLSMSRMKRE